ncbi:hypothetical protein [Tenacibaculum agarivorans]|uniref:hypothetical protein n=1 Tax=Tenacibaculum agarivorans TaxID=1908389 RepID=UPI00094B9342|nr:hypothetical protein [Tenacibaculum agarivorans]
MKILVKSIIVVCIAALYSCNSGDEDVSMPKELQEVVIGYSLYDDGREDREVATIWRNGEPSRLVKQGENFFPTGAIAYGNDLYVIGARNQGEKRQAVMLKNDELIVLWEGSRNAAPKGIYVDDNDVHVVGIQMEEGGNQRAVYWKNGEKEDLAKEGNSNAEGVYVYNDKVYVVGGQNDNKGSWDPILWTNGVSSSLEKNKPTSLGSRIAYDVYVDANNIYIIGEDLRDAVMWHNGDRTLLAEDSQSFSIAYDGTTFNAVGYEDLFNRKAVVWSASGTVSLDEGSTANDIKFFKENRYVSGVLGSGPDRKAAYWKNDELITLKKLAEDVSSYYAIAISVYER